MSDRETRSTWNAYGLALDRPLKSTQLKQVILVPRFWFAWSQFRSGTASSPHVRRRNHDGRSSNVPWNGGGSGAAPLNLDAREPAQIPRTSDRGPSTRTGETHAGTGPLEGFEAVLVERGSPGGQPGEAPAPGLGHRHSGFVVGYVLEGQLRFAINNEPERIVPAGGTFFEPIGALHSTSGAVPACRRAFSRSWWSPMAPGGGAGLTEADLKVRLSAHGTARTATHPARA